MSKTRESESTVFGKFCNDYERVPIGIKAIFPYSYKGRGTLEEFLIENSRDFNYKSVQLYLYCMAAATITTKGIKINLDSDEFLCGKEDVEEKSAGASEEDAPGGNDVAGDGSVEEGEPVATNTGLDLEAETVDETYEIILGAPEITMKAANSYAKDNIGSIIQIVFDTGACYALKALSEEHITNFRKMTKLDDDKATPSIGDMLKIIKWVGNTIGSYVSENMKEIKTLVSDNLWVEYRLSTSAAGKLCTRIFDCIPPTYVALVSVEDREAARLASNDPWDINLARKISDRGLAVTALFVEIFKIKINTFWMGDKALKSLPLSVTDRLRAVLETIRDTDDSIKKIRAQLSGVEAYAAFAEANGLEVGKEILDVSLKKKQTRVKAWQRDLIAAKKIKLFKDAIKSGTDAELDASYLDRDELATVDTFMDDPKSMITSSGELKKRT